MGTKALSLGRLFLLLFLLLAMAGLGAGPPNSLARQAPSYVAGQGTDPHEPHQGLHGIVGRFETAVGRVEPLLEHYGYAALFLSVLIEGFAIPAPGQTLLMAASLDAARGRLSILWVLAVGCAAAMLGNAVGYLIGRWGGRSLVRRIKVNEAHLRAIEERFTRHGKGILLFARFFDGLRQLNGIVAGLLNMSWREFAILNALGAVLWTGAWALLVYSLGKKIAFIHLVFAKLEPSLLFLALVLLVAMAVYLLRHRRGKRLDATKP